MVDVVFLRKTVKPRHIEQRGDREIVRYNQNSLYKIAYKTCRELVQSNQQTNHGAIDTHLKIQTQYLLFWLKVLQKGSLFLVDKSMFNHGVLNIASAIHKR